LATESPNLFFTPSTTFAGAQRLSVGELTFADDGETIQITGGEETRDGIQVIAHLGNSVLGRFRWAERSFPFGDDHLFEQVEMRPFQTAVARSAEVVLFFSDRVGRANYARLEVEVPALAADAGPPPRLDAQLLRPTQGDTVVVGADGHTVNVQVTGARAPEAADYDTLFLWMGNRLVDQVDLRPHFAALAGEEETFPVEMTIPQELIRSMQDPRVGGPDAAAFALWLDFSTGLNTDLNLPTSEHVLLTGVRTVDLPWPYGPPTVQLLGGGPLEFVRQGRFHAHAEGPLPDGYRIFHAVDGGTPTELAAPGEAFATEVLPRGEHVLEFYLTDAAGNLLTAQDPTVRFPFLVVNGPPVPALDGYATRPDEPLVVTAAEGVAQNDDDPEGDALAVSLVHGPEDGTLTLRGDGSFEYAPAAGFIGIDSFTYAVEDGMGGTAQGRVLIDVRDQTPVAAPADWSQLGNGPGHQGVVQRHTAAAPLTPLWRRTLDVEGIERVVVADGRVLVAATRPGGRFDAAALNLGTGELLWSRRLTGSGERARAPVHANGLFYVQLGESGDDALFALRTEDGREIWQAEFPSSFSPFDGVVAGEGRLWAHFSATGLRALDGADGAVLFTNEDLTSVSTTPAWHRGRLYTWSYGVVYENDATTGETLRTVDLFEEPAPGVPRTPSSQAVTPAAADGILVGVERGVLMAFAIDALELLWQREGPYLDTVPALDGSDLFVVEAQRAVRLNRLSGQVRQTYEVPQPLLTEPPVLTRDHLFVASAEQTYVFDRARGDLVATLPVGGRLSIAYDRLLVAAETGAEVSAWALADVLPTFDYPPVAQPDHFTAQAGRALRVPDIAGGAGLFRNDYDLEGAPLTAELVAGPDHGELVFSADGSFVYTADPGFEGVDGFSYRVFDGSQRSAEAAVEIVVKAAGQPFVATRFFRGGEMLDPSETLAGKVEVEMTVTDAQGLEPRFFFNQRLLVLPDLPTAIPSDRWTVDVVLDTAMGFDGENLLSVQLLPPLVPGEPWPVRSWFDATRIVTRNGPPAPNGDYYLPTLEIDEAALVLDRFLDRDFVEGPYDPDYTDDGAADWNGWVGGPVIARLGRAVLPRRIENTHSAGGGPFGRVELAPFQSAQVRQGSVVIFFADEVGRANYTSVDLAIPADSAAAVPRARIVEPRAGDSLLLDDERTLIVTVELSGLDSPFLEDYRNLVLWVGGEPIETLDLTAIREDLPAGEESLRLELPIDSTHLWPHHETTSTGALDAALLHVSF
ncbi:MAG: Ig-like domain-containing protein, partial [Opitutales bacterium]